MNAPGRVTPALMGGLDAAGAVMAWMILSDDAFVEFQMRLCGCVVVGMIVRVVEDRGREFILILGLGCGRHSSLDLPRNDLRTKEGIDEKGKAISPCLPPYSGNS